MQDYKIECQQCGQIEGYSDVPAPDNMPTKCSECDGDMSVKRIFREEAEPADFDIFITNKRTAISKHMGFTMSAKDMEEKTGTVFIQKATAAFVELFSQTNINQLCEQK